MKKLSLQIEYSLDLNKLSLMFLEILQSLFLFTPTVWILYGITNNQEEQYSNLSNLIIDWDVWKSFLNK